MLENLVKRARMGSHTHSRGLPAAGGGAVAQGEWAAVRGISARGRPRGKSPRSLPAGEESGSSCAVLLPQGPRPGGIPPLPARGSPGETPRPPRSFAPRPRPAASPSALPSAARGPSGPASPSKARPSSRPALRGNWRWFPPAGGWKSPR